MRYMFGFGNVARGMPVGRGARPRLGRPSPWPSSWLFLFLRTTKRLPERRGSEVSRQGPLKKTCVAVYCLGKKVFTLVDRRGFSEDCSDTACTNDDRLTRRPCSTTPGGIGKYGRARETDSFRARLAGEVITVTVLSRLNTLFRGQGIKIGGS